MSSKQDGGPAFPSNFAMQIVKGMSLRDYFAAMALPSQMTFAIQMFKDSSGEEQQTGKDVAQACYAIADAMLKARQK